MASRLHIEIGPWRLAPAWAVPAGLSLVSLGLLAPSGLALLGFLAVVILVHEAAHLVAARWAGMGPTEFFWGFGPEIVSFRRGECRYGVKAVFAGGYVKLLGMTPTAPLPAGFPEERTYRAASHRGRLVTILAGPAANLVLAVAAFALAAVIDGRPLGAALGAGVRDVGLVAWATAQALGTWVAHLDAYVVALFHPAAGAEVPVRFLSPVSEAQTTGWALARGPAMALRWLAILSAAVGVANLAPLPPLDGSHALVAAAEGVWHRLRPAAARRPFDVTRLAPLAYVTVVMLVFLSVSALVLDLRDLG